MTRRRTWTMWLPSRGEGRAEGEGGAERQKVGTGYDGNRSSFLVAFTRALC